jgi:hypothetical protein
MLLSVMLYAHRMSRFIIGENFVPCAVQTEFMCQNVGQVWPSNNQYSELLD